MMQHAENSSRKCTPTVSVRQKTGISRPLPPPGRTRAHAHKWDISRPKPSLRSHCRQESVVAVEACSRAHPCAWAEKLPDVGIVHGCLSGVVVPALDFKVLGPLLPPGCSSQSPDRPMHACVGVLCVYPYLYSCDGCAGSTVWVSTCIIVFVFGLWRRCCFTFLASSKETRVLICFFS